MLFYFCGIKVNPMTRFILLFATLIGFISGCQQQNSNPASDIDAAQAFIRHCNQNEFEQAKPLLLPDKTNEEYFEMARQKFGQQSKEELEAYKSADIIIHEIKPVSDSVSIISYSNSNKQQVKQNLKLVRQNGNWLVDLKYTF